MRVLRLFLDFYLQSSLHVGFAVLALAHCTLLQFNLFLPPHFLPTVFWGTVLGYNVLKYASLFYSNKIKSVWHRAIALCTALATLCFVVELYQLPNSLQLVVLSSGLSVLCYPFLRSYGWLKLFFVSAAVTYTTVFVPLWTGLYDTELLVQIIQRFFLVSSLLIPFEIWDSQFDGAHLHTLPQRLGIQKTKQLGYSFLLPVIALMGWQPNYQLATLGVVVLAALSIYFASLQRSTYYTSFWVESVPIVWWVILVLMK